MRFEKQVISLTTVHYPLFFSR